MEIKEPEEYDILGEVREKFKNKDKEQPKKEEQKPTKKSRRGLKIKLLVLLVEAIALIVLLAVDGWAVNLWSQYNILEPQKPIELHSPIKHIKLARPRNYDVLGFKPAMAENITKEDKHAIIMGAGLGWIVEKINTLESTNGTATEGHHKFCESIGKTNEFGFFKNGNRFHCFDTFEESVKDVTARLAEMLETMTLPEALCLYSGHGQVNDCSYWRDFQKL